MKTMKFLVCMTFAGMLCSCGSDKEVFESWKGWVAMNTCSYNLKEEFKKEYANKGDLSSLFYENETSVVYFDISGSGDSWKTSDLSVLGSNIYSEFELKIYDEYFQLIKNNDYKSDDDIVMSALNRSVDNVGVTNYRVDFMHTPWLISDENGVLYWGVEDNLPDSLQEFYHTYYPILVQYNVDWLFRNENNLKTLANDLLCLCGSYSDFYDFVMDSVSVLDSEWIENRAGSDVYDVIYQIDAGDSTKYALCQILVNDENSEIQLINSSDSLMDLY